MSPHKQAWDHTHVGCTVRVREFTHLFDSAFKHIWSTNYSDNQVRHSSMIIAHVPRRRPRNRPCIHPRVIAVGQQRPKVVKTRQKHAYYPGIQWLRCTIFGILLAMCSIWSCTQPYGVLMLCFFVYNNAKVVLSPTIPTALQPRNPFRTLGR